VTRGYIETQIKNGIQFNTELAFEKMLFSGHGYAGLFGGGGVRDCKII
jgi:hypothetical protein